MGLPNAAVNPRLGGWRFQESGHGTSVRREIVELLTPLYEWPLVALSVLIAIAAAYVALDLASSVTVARGRPRIAWLIGGSIAMGVGLWSVQILGMLAVHVPGLQMAYDVPLLILSALVSIAGSALALTLVSRSRSSIFPLVVATIGLGSAIAGTHFLGIAALHMPATITWHGGLAGLSIAIAFGASGLAVWLGFRFRDDISARGFRSRGVGALVVGSAIASMHLVGMAALRLQPHAGSWVLADDQLPATSGLTMAVGLGSLLVLAMALSGAMVERAFARRSGLAFRADRRARDEGALRSLAHDLVVSEDLPETLRRLVIRSVDIGEADGGYVEVIHEGEVVVEAVAGTVGPRLGVRIPLPGSLTEEALEWGKPEALEDVLEKDRPIGAELERTCGRCRAMLIPVRALSRPVGTLILLRRRDRRPFTETDLFSATVVGDLASIGIQRAERAQERESLLQRISELYEAAQQALADRDDLLAIVSHDLRNPLTAIGARAQLLARHAPEGDSGDRVRASAEALRASTQRMAALIDDLTETASVVQGRLTIDARSVDPSELLLDAVTMFAPLATSRGLELRHEMRGSLRPVACDPDRVMQVLSNLVGNALQITPAPGVITLQASGDGDEVRFAVTDTGPGIAPVDWERIFHRHVRGKTGTYKGAGLGLAISRGIIQAHGGHLWVESEEGVGSTFFFTLPVAT